MINRLCLGGSGRGVSGVYPYHCLKYFPDRICKDFIFNLISSEAIQKYGTHLGREGEGGKSMSKCDIGMGGFNG